MRASCAPALAFLRNHFSALRALAYLHVVRRQMRIPRGDSKSMIENHYTSVTFAPARPRYHAIGRRTHTVVIMRRDVQSSVEFAFSIERIQPLPKRAGDSSHHRPKRRNK